jgi:acetyltransferase-like isoleucine patch superfamily enzyme
MTEKKSDQFALSIHQIHPTAIIAKSAKIGQRATIGANSILYPNVTLGDDCIVGPNCTLGEPLAEFYDDDQPKSQPACEIGHGAIIRSGSIIYAGTKVGHRFGCGHRVTIRENCRIGNDCRIGTQSQIQHEVRMGDFVRVHSNVFVAETTTISDYVWLFPGVIITNDPYPPSNESDPVFIAEYAAIAAGAVILPGIRIGQDALVGALALVREDVKPYQVVVGNPAKRIADVRNLKHRNSGGSVYPWREHFDRGMPWEGQSYRAWHENHQQ